MKKILFSLLLTTVSLTGWSQPVPFRNVVPVEVDKLDYPNLTGNTTSTQPFPGTVTLKNGKLVKGKVTFFKKKGEFERVKVKTEEDKIEILAAEIASIVLDPRIYEGKYPNNFKKPEKNLQTGYIILPSGERVNGKVAQLRDFSDYDFFIYTILFLPEGSELASSIKGGKLIEFGQVINGVLNVWDGYADGYVLRLADGRFRLSRNPYSKTKNEFFTGLKNQMSDSLAKEVAGNTLAAGLKSGNDINESIENAANAGSAVKEVLGAIEINRKEYLIFDTTTKSVTPVNSDTFKTVAPTLAASCGTTAEARWDKIEEFVKAVNAACQK